MRAILSVCCLLILMCPPLTGQPTSLLTLDRGEVAFTSDAPLELIQARSTELRGVIDSKRRTFAFSLPIRSFQGFNGPLQREHFNENYLESERYPTATFLGKIIEPIDLTREGEYTLRAKGKLTIHGIERERIIKSTVTVAGGEVRIQTAFSVALGDHGIEIPRIVYQKIAERIDVLLNATLVEGSL